MLNKNQKYVHPFTYEEQLKIDINTIKQDSYEEGIEHGIEQGIEQGFQKGIEKKQIETVENMAKEKIEPGIISKCVGLPLSRVQQIISSIIL